MDSREAIDFIDKTIYIGLLVVSPMLLAGLVVGLIIAILQSITQVQEMTLTFIPKVFVMIAVFVFTLPWTADMIMDFMREIFMRIANAGAP